MKRTDLYLCPVIFATKDFPYLNDATALENFGVEADPTARKLKPVLGIISEFLGSRPDRYYGFYHHTYNKLLANSANTERSPFSKLMCA